MNEPQGQPEPPARAIEPAGEPLRPAPARKRVGRLSTLGMLGLAVLSKAKGFLLLLQGLKLGKLLITFVSMFAMIALEASRYGLWYAVGFVLLIFVHEMGHAVAIKRVGLDAGYPVFIPFVGAFISLRGQPRTAKDEAEIALAGPLAGAAASVACAALYLFTRERLFLALAYGGFFLNLFNMTPLPPLDGGRAAMVFSRRAWWIGLAILAALFLVTRTPQLLLIGVFALMHGFGGQPRLAAPPDVQRQVAATFFGLCAFLAMGIYLTHGALAGSGF